MPWKTAGSLLSRHRKTLIDEEDCHSIRDLLNNGFSFREALDLLETEQNQKVFSIIRRNLENGEEAGSFLSEFLPVQYRSHFACFLRFLNLADSLSLSITVADEDKKEKENLVKQLFYPALLFFAGTIGILIFTKFCFPPLISMMESFRVDPSGSILLARMMEMLSFTLLTLAGCAAVMVLLLKRPGSAMKYYGAFAKRHPHSLPVTITSLDFVRFYHEASRMEPSTRKVLKLLEENVQKPLTSHIACLVEVKLQEGCSFEKAMETEWLDPMLRRFVKTAVYASNLNEMLESYLQLARKRVQQKTKRLTAIVQVCAYGIIGMVLILVYQVLMLPMSMLSQF
ncbi:MAG: type II secretion system F family protein [Bulleidia sp.]|nr:type II secretion system F family protein [Bulleidia sp.]